MNRHEKDIDFCHVLGQSSEEATQLANLYRPERECKLLKVWIMLKQKLYSDEQRDIHWLQCIVEPVASVSIIKSTDFLTTGSLVLKITYQLNGNLGGNKNVASTQVALQPEMTCWHFCCIWISAFSFAVFPAAILSFTTSFYNFSSPEKMPLLNFSPNNLGTWCFLPWEHCHLTGPLPLSISTTVQDNLQTCDIEFHLVE